MGKKKEIKKSNCNFYHCYYSLELGYKITILLVNVKTRSLDIIDKYYKISLILVMEIFLGILF